MRAFWPIAIDQGQIMPYPWWIATAYAERYSMGVHTGIDLNLPNYADSRKPVYAIWPGRVVFSGDGTIIGWPAARNVVVIEHSNVQLWTRYAHLAPGTINQGATVAGGERLGIIGDYGTPGPASDHLHFDICALNLSTRPGHWPGLAANALVEVLTYYRNPLEIFRMVNA